MFDLDQFIADCRAASAADKSHKNVREIVARAALDARYYPRAQIAQSAGRVSAPTRRGSLTTGQDLPRRRFTRASWRKRS